MLKVRNAGAAAAMSLALMLAAGTAHAQDKPAVSPSDEPAAEASEAGAKAGMITGSDFDEMIASFERNGLSVKLTRDSDGDPRLRSTDDDNPFSVIFYQCTDNEDCQVIQFSAGWNLKNGISRRKIEEWNADKLWGQAYRDDEKDPWLAMTVNLYGGVPVENFDDTVDWWRVVSRDFERHIGWDED